MLRAGCARTQGCAFHRSPLFRSRWKSSSTIGVWFSLVSSDFRKIEGPKCGHATRNGRLRIVFPAWMVWSFETNCCASSAFASVCAGLLLSGLLLGTGGEVSAVDSDASKGVTRKLLERSEERRVG